MADIMPHWKNPCQECPWSKETPPGQFSAERYVVLRATSGSPGKEAWIDAPLFACHKSIEGKDVPCAGWLAAVGYESLHIRRLLAQGHLPISVMKPGESWPPLFETYAEMEKAQAAVPAKKKTRAR